MSEMELHIGKIKKVFKSDSESLEDVAQRLLDHCGYVNDSGYYDTPLEALAEEFYHEYVVTGESIYEIIEDMSPEYGHIMYAQLNGDGFISYVLHYYNGGCGFSEALETAIKGME